MKTVTAGEMKRLDALAVRRYGIPALILMENAGRAAAEAALEMLPGKARSRVAVFCGYGNNGGDGFVCARHLINRGVNVGVYLVGPVKELSAESRVNYLILRRMKQPLIRVRGPRQSAAAARGLKGCRLIIDAVFGIGLRGEPDGFYQGLFAMLNSSGIPILSLDIPSGLDADTGRPLGITVRAARTVTFGFAKAGLVKKRARAFTGVVSVADISIPRRESGVPIRNTK